MSHTVETESYKAGYETGLPGAYDKLRRARFDTEEQALRWLFDRTQRDSSLRIEIWIDRDVPGAESELILSAVRWDGRWNLDC